MKTNSEQMANALKQPISGEVIKKLQADAFARSQAALAATVAATLMASTDWYSLYKTQGVQAVKVLRAEVLSQAYLLLEEIKAIEDVTRE